MKRLFLGLFVAVIALSASAFTNVETNPQATSYYGNEGGGLYTLIDPLTLDPGNCFSSDANPCIYSSEQAPVSSFTIGTPSQPSDIQQVGSDERLYNFN